MGSIQYIQEDILNGFTEEVLKELAKKLKRRIGLDKNDIIQEILSTPKGKREDKAKLWQEINRLLRKDLETVYSETSKMLSLEAVPLSEQFKYGYMLTLSASPEIRAQGEQIYLQAQENKIICTKNELENTADKAIAAGAELETFLGAAEETELDKEITATGEKRAVPEAKEENIKVEIRKAKKMTEKRTDENLLEVSKKIEMINAMEENKTQFKPAKVKVSSEKKSSDENKELSKMVRILENKLTLANKESQKIKEQYEKLKLDMTTLKSLLIREKEETKKYRKIAEDLQVENNKKEKEIESLKLKSEHKSEQNKSTLPEKIKYPAEPKVPPQNLNKYLGQVDLSFYQGRKALIFAERDNEVDTKLNALGIIPIWAMEIDWNRPRRRMSTCEIILYKKDNEKLEKLDEIRDLARSWNIPCNEIVNI